MICGCWIRPRAFGPCCRKLTIGQAPEAKRLEPPTESYFCCRAASVLAKTPPSCTSASSSLTRMMKKGKRNTSSTKIQWNERTRKGRCSGLCVFLLLTSFLLLSSSFFFLLSSSFFFILPFLPSYFLLSSSFFFLPLPACSFLFLPLLFVHAEYYCQMGVGV